MAALEARQLADLTFQEVSRSLRALSSTYVERRTKLKEGAALAGAGKRAAFALFYGPLHYLVVQHIVSTLGAPFVCVERLTDLGCGTGASGAGWAAACPHAPTITGIDRHPWAIEEARHTYADLGFRAQLRVDDMTRVSLHGSSSARHGAGTRNGKQPLHSETELRRTGVLLAYAVNEIAEPRDRDTLLDRLTQYAASGGRVLVIEPMAGFVAPWWSKWQSAFEQIGGCARQWRFRADLPAIVEKLGRAAGLNSVELKARSLSA